jgi:renal tumor antigen
MQGDRSVGSDLRVLCKLGEGSFAEVFKAKSVRRSALVAIKRLKKRYRSPDDVYTMSEILSLQALQGHPNIVHLIDVMFDPGGGSVALVFELLDCNLYEFTKDRRAPLEEPFALLLIYQLLKATAFMHSKSIFHRDIKPENCMINKTTLELKLVDFGSTRSDTDSLPYTEYISTRWYRAPECILTSGSYGKAVDVWAIGCILYELLTARPLFPGKHEIDQIARIHNIIGSPTKEILDQFRSNPNTQLSFSFPVRKPQDFHNLLPNCSDETVDLLGRLLEYDPRKRVSASVALSHPAFRQLRRTDGRWQQTAQIYPFSLFYVHEVTGVRQEAAQNVVGDDQEEEEIQDDDDFEENGKEAPKMNGNGSLQESRLRAIQRIREYNKKKLGNAVGKPKFIQQSKAKYPVPGPGIVQPKLPRIRNRF